MVIIAIISSVGLSSCGNTEVYVYDNNLVGDWWITFNYDDWGYYDDGGIMSLYPNGEYDYYYSERDYHVGRVGYYGRWWIDRDNLIYTTGYDTYSYRITSQGYDYIRLRNNLPPGDFEVWYRY